MMTRATSSWSLITFMLLAIAGCGDDGPAGPAGQDAAVYYSEWFSPSAWSGVPGDWYFSVPAPDLTEDVVESGVVLAYAWLEGDLYDGNSVRPLPAYAVGANWSFLVHEYGAIEFNCDMIAAPGTSGNFFRFVAIPGTIAAAKSASAARYREHGPQDTPYGEIAESFD